MIWGKDNADLASKLSNVKAEGDLQPGDKFDTKIWTYSSATPTAATARLFVLLIQTVARLRLFTTVIGTLFFVDVITRVFGF